jgi:hypothetical protein
MIGRLLQEMALAAMVSLVFGGGFTWAQSAYAPPPPVVNANVMPLANQPAVPAGPVLVDTPVGDSPAPHRSHPVRDAFESYLPLGCWTHHNAFGCGSFHSDATFIFGSCRAFFGQQCLKEPPPDALAPMREGTPDAAAPPRARLPFSFCPSCR